MPSHSHKAPLLVLLLALALAPALVHAFFEQFFQHQAEHQAQAPPTWDQQVDARASPPPLSSLPPSPSPAPEKLTHPALHPHPHPPAVSCATYVCPDSLVCAATPADCPCPSALDTKCTLGGGEGAFLCARDCTKVRTAEVAFA